MRAVTSIRLSGGELPSVRVGTDGTAVVSFDGDDSTVELVGPAEVVEKWNDTLTFELNVAKQARRPSYRLVQASAVFCNDRVSFPRDGLASGWLKVNRAERPDPYTIRFWLADCVMPRDVHPDEYIRVAYEEAVA